MGYASSPQHVMVGIEKLSTMKFQAPLEQMYSSIVCRGPSLFTTSVWN